VIPKEFERSDLALETELNAAILEIGKEDFLLENFDLQSLFSESLNRYYSDEVVLWLGTELTNGKQAAFQRLADVLEPVHTVLEMGVGSGPWRTLLDRGCHSLVHGPCLETTGRHRRTNRGPGVGGPERELDVENVDADPGGKPHFRRLAQLRAWVEHLQNGP